MRIALGLEYDGSCFHGWQWQQHEPQTVQAELERALSSIADRPVRVMCAGRTDAGVHASHQVVHFDTEAKRADQAWSRGANTLLPHNIAVKWAKKVPETFHARYSALSRTYRYVLYNSAHRPGMLRPFLSWFYKPLDVAVMRRAATYLLGEQDFTSLRAKDCQSRSSKRCIQAVSLEQQGPFIVLEIRANAFLKHMVRNIVGLLVTVGQGDREPDWVLEVLAARDRSQAGITASPHGLSLVNIEYPAEFDLPRAVCVSVPLMAACVFDRGT
ncbi:MAG: tRNA pseudouridine(38-40) synthase TruA [Gammaproteobacteria bacterium]